MAGDRPTPTISLEERSFPVVGSAEKLSKWLTFSLLLHATLIVGLFLAPHLPRRARPSYPIYTVDLVGGEKIGTANLGSVLAPSPVPPAMPKTVEAEAPATPEETKRESRKEKAEKTKPVEKAAPMQEKTTAKESAKKEPSKKESTRETAREAKSETAALDSVRERLLQSAVERAKNRTVGAQKSAKGEIISSGAGESVGAATLGKGPGQGGGVVRGMEFIIYHNNMVTIIKENWAWAGPKGSLKVVVHFGIKDNGEIVGVKILQPSGDPSYDESVLRAVRKSSPLPVPPESYRKDFADVELTFRP